MGEAPKKLCQVMFKDRRGWKIKCLQIEENKVLNRGEKKKKEK